MTYQQAQRAYNANDRALSRNAQDGKAHKVSQCVECIEELLAAITIEEHASSETLKQWHELHTRVYWLLDSAYCELNALQ